MKGSKKLIALAMSVITATAAFAFTACGENHTHTNNGKWEYDGSKHWHVATCEGHEDTKYDEAGHDIADGKCNVCGYEVSPSVDPNPNPDPPAHTHAWVDGHCDGCGSNITDKSSDDTDNDESVSMYVDATGTATAVTPKIPTYSGPAAALQQGSQDVDYVRDIASLEAGTLASDWTDGIFTVPSGTEVRTRSRTSSDGLVLSKSLKLGAGSLNLSASAPGTLVLYLDNGSSSANSAGILVTGPDDTQGYGYDKDGKAVKLTIEIEKAGNYVITRDNDKNGTTDIYYAKFSARVDNKPITEINISNSGATDFYVGQQLDCTGIAVTTKHENGMVAPVDNANIQVDASAYDSTKPGTYEIKVTYNIAGNLNSSKTSFETSYNVNVYGFDGLELGTDKITKDENSAAGNSVYFNHTVRQFYFTGETFSKDGLSVILKGKLGDKTKDFLLADGAYTVTAPDLTSAGKKTVKVEVTANGVTKALGYNVYAAVKDASLASAASVDLAVNPEFSTKNVGVKNEYGAYRFKTVQQALDFVNASGISASATKNIYLAEGEYNEKLEVTAPNVCIIGAGRDKTKIEYNSLYGETDKGGFEHTTDSTQTLAVRDTATGFTIKNLTVSNFYNSDESYANAKSTDRRALAALIQADKVIFDNCALLGYQDTLELFTGRQMFKNCYISGTTDFIFGSNNTTYFYQCEIHSISNGKGTDGGYVTAFKGCNKGAADSIVYGAIFDECRFTAPDSETAKATTAIGRAWGQYAAVAVINSEIGGHVTTKGYTSGSKNERYVAMNAKPSDSTVQFVEYNNTGAGAVSTQVGGMKMLTATDAAKYGDLSVIFGKTNGNVTYSDAWTPSK